MAALQRALALTEVDDPAVRVGQHLHLDVARPLDEPLEQEAVVAERGGGDTPGGGQRVGEVVCRTHHLHPLAAAARGWLDQQRVPCGLGGLRDGGIGHADRAEAGDGRHTVPGDVLLRADLVAHDLERALPRSDEDDAGRGACARELGVLREEAVARVHGVGPGLASGRAHGVDVEI